MKYTLEVDGHIVVLTDPDPKQAFFAGILGLSGETDPDEVERQWALLHVDSIDGYCFSASDLDVWEDGNTKLNSMGKSGLDAIVREVRKLDPLNY